MRHCLQCETSFNGEGWECANCGYQPDLHKGIPCFAPDIDDANAFDVESYADFGDSIERSYWFRPRNHLIAWAFNKYFPDARDFLEVGCATGFVLKGLAAGNPKLNLTGADIYHEGLAMAAKKLGGRADFMQLNALSLPFRGHFDVIGAFDVVEHIDDDVAAFEEFNRAVKPGGGIMIIVPRHMFLWSAVDDAARHKRRYSGAELSEKINRAGFEIIRQLSFGALTLPLQYLSRRIVKPKGEKLSDALEMVEMPGLAGYLLEKLLVLDQMFVRMGLDYPFGGSLMVIARKKA